MAEFLLVGTAVTNSVTSSLVQVQVDDLLCTITIVPNELGDSLPTIQKASRTLNNKVLYHLKLKARLVQRAGGKPAPGHVLALKSSRPGDKLTVPPKTDDNGELVFTIETREKGEAVITTTTQGVTLAEFKVTFKEAWYEEKFKITGYNVCDEADFTGTLVDGTGLDEKHKEDFLFGAAGVPMQGTGKGTDGRYIRLQSFEGGWHRNARGNRDHVNTQSSVTFAYADGVIGSFNPVSANHSIAVDPHVIPKKGKVHIESVGERWADDRGSAIQNYHIDNFLGAGKAVVTAWTKGEVNGTQRRVKYLGE
ncbi:3D domain-containing protein [Duganella margarita]|nr:3D domain-containing protein [Duganella margarita]